MKSTKAFAAEHGIKTESVHKRLSQTGSYFGFVPTKLVNGRLDFTRNAAGSAKQQPKPL